MEEYKEIADQLRQERFTTKEDLLEWITATRQKQKLKAETDKKHSAAFYHIYDQLLERFYKKISSTVLFSHLEDFWYYTVCIYDEGARLDLEHASRAWVGEHGTVVVNSDQSFTLILVKNKQLTVEEYAAEYGVGTGTVRQWIRRGKIRNAVKVGAEWRIPQLTEMPGRGGYESGLYIWYERLKDLPEEFAFLNNYACAIFNRDPNDKAVFHITYAARGVESKEVTCDNKEREKIELFMIAHPQIHFGGLPENAFNIQISTKDVAP